MRLITMLTLGLLFTPSARADLAERFRGRQDEARANDLQRQQEEAVKNAYGIVEYVGKSKIIGSPEIRPASSASAEVWYFRMANRRICSVMIRREADGRVGFAWHHTAKCVQD